MALAIVLACLTWPTDAGGQTEFCGLPAGVKGLLTEVFEVAAADTSPDPASLRRLAIMLDVVKRENALNALEESSGSEVHRAFEKIIEYARALIGGQPVETSEELGVLIGTVWEASDSHCSAISTGAPIADSFTSASDDSGGDSQDAAGPAMQPLGLKDYDATFRAVEKQSEDVPGAQLWLLGYLMVALVLGIVLFRGAVYVLRRYFPHRKGCRISGAYELGLDVVDGYIIEISRKNLVFKPVNRNAFKRICRLLADSEDGSEFIDLDDVRVPVETTELGDGVILYRIRPTLSPWVFDDILAKSLISPFEIKPNAVTEEFRPKDTSDSRHKPDAA